MENKKKSEIEVVRELIKRLKNIAPKQCITLDALHGQKETVKQITQAGYEYLITVKTNQPKLYRLLYTKNIGTICSKHAPDKPQRSCTQ